MLGSCITPLALSLRCALARQLEFCPYHWHESSLWTKTSTSQFRSDWPLYSSTSFSITLLYSTCTSSLKFLAEFAEPDFSANRLL